MKSLFISGIVGTILLFGTGSHAAWFTGAIISGPEVPPEVCLNQANNTPAHIMCRTESGHLIEVLVRNIYSTSSGHTMRVIHQTYL
ncbi:hypothetical protein F9C28_07085 [Shimwellia pseudoproteus]|uniref:hypothetical protein n=1 Tax=Shimwellia pseudoproteus TaxID=570012 RepID=UPI0018EB1514|nr:hypothetical protein [Shimwellia pseudoproteus]MBJ3814692.1 hypothetical protein [Shimwellia pseudoproteus]